MDHIRGKLQQYTLGITFSIIIVRMLRIRRKRVLFIYTIVSLEFAEG